MIYSRYHAQWAAKAAAERARITREDAEIRGEVPAVQAAEVVQQEQPQQQAAQAQQRRHDQKRR